MTVVLRGTSTQTATRHSVSQRDRKSRTNGFRIVQDKIVACLRLSAHGPGTRRSSSRNLQTVVLKFWLDHVDARRKSFQVYVNLLLQELSSILILPTLPWHSMVAARCHVLLTLAQRRQLGCVFDPSSPEDLFLPCQGHGRGMCALILRGVCKSWTSGHLPSTLGFMTSARIASPASRGPDLSWDSRRALHRSPPNEFDRHASSSRGSLRSSITMHSTLACPRHTYRRHPLLQLSSCLMSSTTRSCMDASRVVWHLHVS